MFGLRCQSKGATIEGSLSLYPFNESVLAYRAADRRRRIRHNRKRGQKATFSPPSLPPLLLPFTLPSLVGRKGERGGRRRRRRKRRGQK